MATNDLVLMPTKPPMTALRRTASKLAPKRRQSLRNGKTVWPDTSQSPGVSRRIVRCSRLCKRQPSEMTTRRADTPPHPRRQGRSGRGIPSSLRGNAGRKVRAGVIVRPIGVSTLSQTARQYVKTSQPRCAQRALTDFPGRNDRRTTYSPRALSPRMPSTPSLAGRQRFLLVRELMARSFFSQLQRDSYKLSRLSGRCSRGESTLLKRLLRRQVTRTLGRGHNKLWR